MTLDDHPVIMIFLGVIGGLFMIFILIIGIFWIDYSLHNYPIVIKQDGIIIYDGIKSCISIESSGDTTTISIYKGFLCMFPKATITGKNIEVKTK